MSNLETQYSDATLSFEQDLFTPFVLWGMIPTADGSIVNQLDTTSGVAFLQQSDNTLLRIHVAASVTSQFTTSTPSTTYYLDLNPDGTWSWGTAHSVEANYLSICQVTTNTSGNISAVTDKRTMNTTLLSTMLGNVQLPNLNSFTVNGTITATTYSGGSGGFTTDSAGRITCYSATINNHLNVTFSSSLDNGAITTNGSGAITILGTVPGSGQTNYLAIQKSGDTSARVAFYVRSDNYGGVALGAGGATYAVQLYGTSTGLTIDHPTVVSGEVTATQFAEAGGSFATDGSGRIACNTITDSGSLSVAGLISANGGVTVPSGKVLTSNGTTSLDSGAITTNGSGTLTASTLKNSTGTVRAASFFTGSATGTFTHGLGTTPSFVGVTSNQSNSTETVGVDTIGATTVHVNEASAWNFVAMATA